MHRSIADGFLRCHTRLVAMTQSVGYQNRRHFVRLLGPPGVAANLFSPLRNAHRADAQPGHAIRVLGWLPAPIRPARQEQGALYPERNRNPKHRRAA